MSDLISRQAAIDEWKNDFKGYVNTLDIPRDDYNGIMAYIDELPSADIICCRECKHVEHDKLFHDYWCRGREVEPDHYCGYAERREKTNEVNH